MFLLSTWEAVNQQDGDQWSDQCPYSVRTVAEQCPYSVRTVAEQCPYGGRTVKDTQLIKIFLLILFNMYSTNLPGKETPVRLHGMEWSTPNDDDHKVFVT